MNKHDSNHPISYGWWKITLVQEKIRRKKEKKDFIPSDELEEEEELCPEENIDALVDDIKQSLQKYEVEQKSNLSTIIAIIILCIFTFLNVFFTFLYYSQIPESVWQYGWGDSYPFFPWLMVKWVGNINYHKFPYSQWSKH